MWFIIKYGLFIANLIVTLAGLTLVGLGAAVLVQLRDLLNVVPVNLDVIPITIIVLGSFIAVIAFFGCCGAIREIRCFLGLYALSMLLLAAGMTYISVVLFSFLGNVEGTVSRWITTAFNNQNLREAFHGVEFAFRCCGSTGPNSYMGILEALPQTCCPRDVEVCEHALAFSGCVSRVGYFFETFGEAIAGVLIVIVIVELGALVFSLSLCFNIIQKRRSNLNYYS